MSLEFLTEKFLIKNNDFINPVIVTGAGGCIGSWIMSILHRSNIKCVGFDLSEKKTRAELILGSEATKMMGNFNQNTQPKPQQPSQQNTQMTKPLNKTQERLRKKLEEKKKNK